MANPSAETVKIASIYAGMTVIAMLIAWGIAIKSGYELTNRDDRLQSAVQAVCDYTRTTDAPEDACGRAQDASNTEYICELNNNDPGTKCWVEVK